MDKENEYLFSDDLRNALAPYGHLTACEALNSPEFLRTLGKIVGITDETMDKIFNEEDDDSIH